jgi:tetratricopeptide (TPR) repeat protein
MLPLASNSRGMISESDWWITSFTSEERAAIENAFTPMGNIRAESLVLSGEPNAIGSLVGHLKKEHLRTLGYKLLEHADAMLDEAVPVLSLHFYLQARGDFFYRWREIDQFALDEAVKSYERQIGLAANALKEFRESKGWGFVPAHAGYRQLRVIAEKRGDFALAKALCEKALLEGWSDNWANHIARIEGKLAKITQKR